MARADDATRERIDTTDLDSGLVVTSAHSPVGWLLLAFALAWGGAIPGVGYRASATELSPDDCRALLSKKQALIADGVETHYRRGPAWASANLTPEQIARVGEFIALGEQLAFRCPVGFDNAVVSGIRGTDPAVLPAVPERLPADLRLARIRALQARQRDHRESRPGGVPVPIRNVYRSGRSPVGAMPNASRKRVGRIPLPDRKTGPVRVRSWRKSAFGTR